MLPDRVALVIPAYNEAPTIAAIVCRALSACRKIYVADDASTDETARIAKTAGAEVVFCSEHAGYGAAVAAGIAHAIRCGADIVALVDGDGAHDVDELQVLYEAHEASRADLTIGSRTLDGLDDRWFPSPKRAANMFATSLFNQVSGAKLSDVASGFRIMGPKALQLDIQQKSFGAAYELIDEALRAGLQIHQHPTHVRYDASELFCTSCSELSDFLGFCARRNVAVSLDCALRALVDQVRERRQRIFVRIHSHTFVLHHARENDAYIFQLQNPWFEKVGATSEADRSWIDLTL